MKKVERKSAGGLIWNRHHEKGAGPTPMLPKDPHGVAPTGGPAKKNTTFDAMALSEPHRARKADGS